MRIRAKTVFQILRIRAKNSVSHFADSPVGYRIHLHIGDACQILPQLNLMFDLVFIDANKWHFKKFGRSSMPFPIRRW